MSLVALSAVSILIGIFHIGKFCFWVPFFKKLLLRNYVADFDEICNVCARKAIIEAAKRIINSDKVCHSYSNLNFGVTFFGTQCRMPSYVIILKSYALQKMVRFFCPPCINSRTVVCVLCEPYTRSVREISPSSGFASYGTLRHHVPPRHLTVLFLVYFRVNLTANYPNCCVVCQSSLCRCQQLTAVSIGKLTALVTKL